MLVSPPIMRSPNGDLPFEIMCDASDYAIEAALGQREDKKAFVIDGPNQSSSEFSILGKRKPKGVLEIKNCLSLIHAKSYLNSPRFTN